MAARRTRALFCAACMQLRIHVRLRIHLAAASGVKRERDCAGSWRGTGGCAHPNIGFGTDLLIAQLHLGT